MTQRRSTPSGRLFATRSLGSGEPPLTWHAPPGKQFTTTRRLRPGYDVEEVDAFLDKAEPRLAAMRATDKGAT